MLFAEAHAMAPASGRVCGLVVPSWRKGSDEQVEANDIV